MMEIHSLLGERIKGIMTKVARLIYRLDFKKMSSAFVDSPGTAIDILDSSEDDFWDSIGENPSKRSLVAKFHSQGEIYREFNIDPMNINGVIEYTNGIDIETIRKDGTFLELSRLTDRYLKVFEVSEVARAGIRFFVLEKSPVPEGSMFNKFRGACAAPITAAATEHLGECNDSSILFEGKGADEIYYRTQFGVHIEDDSERMLFPKGGTDSPDLFVKENFNVICDIDLFEKDVSFKEFTLSGWSKTKIDKADKFAKSLADALAQ